MEITRVGAVAELRAAIRTEGKVRGQLRLRALLAGAAGEHVPRVHRVASLLKLWLLGTHQGAVGHEYLDYYLDEFTFRFNRRKSASRGKLFYRLAQQAVHVAPVPFDLLVEHSP